MTCQFNRYSRKYERSQLELFIEKSKTDKKGIYVSLLCLKIPWLRVQNALHVGTNE